MKIPNLGSRKNRILLKELVKTDFKLRYQGSLLGYLWAVLRPMMLFAILYVVFAKILKMGSDIPHYPVYLLDHCRFRHCHRPNQLPNQSRCRYYFRNYQWCDPKSWLALSATHYS